MMKLVARIASCCVLAFSLQGCSESPENQLKKAQGDPLKLIPVIDQMQYHGEGETSRTLRAFFVRTMADIGNPEYAYKVVDEIPDSNEKSLAYIYLADHLLESDKKDEAKKLVKNSLDENARTKAYSAAAEFYLKAGMPDEAEALLPQVNDSKDLIRLQKKIDVAKLDKLFAALPEGSREQKAGWVSKQLEGKHADHFLQWGVDKYLALDFPFNAASLAESLSDDMSRARAHAGVASKYVKEENNDKASSQITEAISLVTDKENGFGKQARIWEVFSRDLSTEELRSFFKENEALDTIFTSLYLIPDVDEWDRLNLGKSYARSGHADELIAIVERNFDGDYSNLFYVSGAIVEICSNGQKELAENLLRTLLVNLKKDYSSDNMSGFLKEILEMYAKCEMKLNADESDHVRKVVLQDLYYPKNPVDSSTPESVVKAFLNAHASSGDTWKYHDSSVDTSVITNYEVYGFSVLTVDSSTSRNKVSVEVTFREKETNAPLKKIHNIYLDNMNRISAVR